MTTAMKTVADATRVFLEASRAEWGSPGAQKAMNKLQQLGPKAKKADLDAAAQLVAGSLAAGEFGCPEVGHVALTLGMLVEMGADARPHVDAALTTARALCEPTLRFARALAEAMPEPEPGHDHGPGCSHDHGHDHEEELDEDEDDEDEGDEDEDDDEDDEELDEDDPRVAAFVAVTARLPEEAEAAKAFAPASLATIALLSRSPEGRARARADRALLAAACDLANEQGGPPNAKFLSTMLHVLDAESLLVLHPESGRGFDVTISGIADNFQLHTLLASALVPRGLPGEAPRPAVALCALGQGPQMVEDESVVAHGVFNLSHWTSIGPDGQLLQPEPGEAAHDLWIWNEGIPADIRAFEGRRVVVLGAPPYARQWHASRLFGELPASLEVTRELPAAEVKGWLSKLGSAPRPTTPHVMHGGP